MTKKIWEKRLLAELKLLPKAERKKILDYYREMYGDKAEAGFSEAEILAEFGSPEACAARILTEEGFKQESPEKAYRASARQTERGASVAEIVGLFFLSLIFILPLAIVALALMITFAALTVSGVIVAAVGGVYAILAPLLSIGWLPAAGIWAQLGIGLATCGVGGVLFSVFAVATKYLTLGTGKALTFIYNRRSLK